MAEDGGEEDDKGAVRQVEAEGNAAEELQPRRFKEAGQRLRFDDP